MRPVFLVVGGALALASCAPTGAAGGGLPGGQSSARQCFYADQAINFRSADAQTIYVRSLRRDVYEMKASGFCRDLDFAQALVIRSSVRGSDRVCAGDWADVYIANADPGGHHCRVQVTRQLTEAEVQALPSRDRP